MVQAHTGAHTIITQASPNETVWPRNKHQEDGDDDMTQ